MTSKIQEKAPSGKSQRLKGKVISNSSFMLSNFLYVAVNLEKKPFVPRDKNDQICTTALYVHSYNL